MCSFIFFFCFVWTFGGGWLQQFIYTFISVGAIKLYLMLSYHSIAVCISKDISQKVSAALVLYGMVTGLFQFIDTGKPMLPLVKFVAFLIAFIFLRSHCHFMLAANHSRYWLEAWVVTYVLYSSGCHRITIVVDRYHAPALKVSKDHFWTLFSMTILVGGSVRKRQY